MGEEHLTGAQRAELWIAELKERQLASREPDRQLPSTGRNETPTVIDCRYTEVPPPASATPSYEVQQMAHAGLQFLWNCGNCNDKSVNDDIHMLGLFPDVSDNQLRRHMVAKHDSVTGREVLDALNIIKEVYYDHLNNQERHRDGMRNFMWKRDW